MSDSHPDWLPRDFVPRLIGRRVLHFDQVDSTNSVAAAHAADPANEGLVVLADAQTAGRGRLGRSWTSPARDGILLSVLLFPPEPLRRPALLTILAAVSVCEAIFETTRLQSTIKWPNDVYVQGKKVCGILVEHSRGPSSQAATIVGIGLNVNTPLEVFGAAGLDQAGSLRTFTGQALDRRRIVQTLVRLLDEGFGELSAGRAADLEARWRFHSALLGRQVSLESRGRQSSGRLLELGFEGVILASDSGELCFLPEEIDRLTPDSKP
jgi:BirA family biotin operon repressor/biotin-[acetyl-CoA-carboxylase] ligase